MCIVVVICSVFNFLENDSLVDWKKWSLKYVTLLSPFFTNFFGF